MLSYRSVVSVSLCSRALAKASSPASPKEFFSKLHTSHHMTNHARCIDMTLVSYFNPSSVVLTSRQPASACAPATPILFPPRLQTSTTIVTGILHTYFKSVRLELCFNASARASAPLSAIKLSFKLCNMVIMCPWE